MEAASLLHEATGEARYLVRARRRLTELVRSAPEEDRERMISNVPLHRRVRG